MSAITLYPYQKQWITDTSRFLEGRWARQTGKSFSSAAKIVLDCRKTERNKWVAISSGERQVKEFMEKIQLHAEITEKAITFHEEVYGYRRPDGYREEYKILEATLKNGSKVIGVPANPDTARGYSANVYLDEFSVHKSSREIWAAVFPIVSRGGYRMIITYTPKGKQNKAYEISNNPMFAHHTVDIHQAVEQGCPHDIGMLKAAIDDEELWQQEYEIKFLDEATAYLTYDMINLVESDAAGKPGLKESGPFYIGNDIGRKRDLWVAWVLEKVGDVLWTREVSILKGAKFSVQDAELDRLVEFYRPIRICMDQTGMGEKPVEDAQRRYGSHRTEGVMFSAAVKQDMAGELKKKFEDRRVRIPIDRAVRDDLHSVKKITTSAGNIRFDAERSEDGHADRFWALALANHAAGDSVPAAMGGADPEAPQRVSTVFRPQRDEKTATEQRAPGVRVKDLIAKEKFNG